KFGDRQLDIGALEAFGQLLRPATAADQRADDGRPADPIGPQGLEVRRGDLDSLGLAENATQTAFDADARAQTDLEGGEHADENGGGDGKSSGECNWVHQAAAPRKVVLG